MTKKLQQYLPRWLGMALLMTVAVAQAYPDHVFANYPMAEDSDPAVHSLVAEGAQLVSYEPRKARKLLSRALEEVSRGAAISEYDYLWTQYGLMKATMEAGTADFGPGTREEYGKVARHLLDFLDNQGGTGEWVYTEIGAFRMEAYRAAANGLAWQMMEDGRDLSRALEIIDRGLEDVRGMQDYYMYDTKVRILLKMDRKVEAWRIVARMLEEDPDFADFQDLRRNPDFLAWRTRQQAAKNLQQ
jgi:hypothetical protein